jgi:carboxymethylenebutenolidase
MHVAIQKIDTPDGEMDLYVARPDDDARGAVIVIQEAFGVNDHIQDVARRFAAAGHLAVAPAIFHRAGGGTADYTDIPTVMKLFEGLTDDGLLADIDAALRFLGEEGIAPERVTVVGFCFGGRVAFLAGARRQLAAVVSFYPGGLVEAGPLPFPGLLHDVPSLRTPWLVLLGADDQSIPAEHVQRLEAALAGVDVVDHRIRVFEGAGHAFHCDARPEMYRPEAAATAWRDAVAWIDQHLPG